MPPTMHLKRADYHIITCVFTYSLPKINCSYYEVARKLAEPPVPASRNTHMQRPCKTAMFIFLYCGFCSYSVHMYCICQTNSFLLLAVCQSKLSAVGLTWCLWLVGLTLLMYRQLPEMKLFVC